MPAPSLCAACHRANTPAEVVSGTESKDDLPVDERLKLAGFDDKEVVGPLTLAEQGMAGAHLKAAIPIDRKQR